MIFDLEKATDVFREKILAAVDEAAQEVYGQTDDAGTIVNKILGIDDRDLPELFRWIDGHMVILNERYAHPLYDNGYMGSEKWWKERIELEAIMGVEKLLPVENLGVNPKTDPRLAAQETP